MMIVKVQLSRFTTHAKRQVLVYDAGGRFRYEGVAPPEVVCHMRGQDRAFFEAEVDARGRFSLGVEVPEERWTAALPS